MWTTDNFDFAIKYCPLSKIAMNSFSVYNTLCIYICALYHNIKTPGRKINETLVYFVFLLKSIGVVYIGLPFFHFACQYVEDFGIGLQPSRPLVVCQITVNLGKNVLKNTKGHSILLIVFVIQEFIIPLWDPHNLLVNAERYRFILGHDIFCLPRLCFFFKKYLLQEITPSWKNRGEMQVWTFNS